MGATTEPDELRLCPLCNWRGTLPVFIRQLGPQKVITDCPECGTATTVVCESTDIKGAEAKGPRP